MATTLRRVSLANAASAATPMTAQEMMKHAETLELQAVLAEREGDDGGGIRKMEQAMQLRAQVAAALAERIQLAQAMVGAEQDGGSAAAPRGMDVDAELEADLANQYVRVTQELYDAAERLVVRCNTVASKNFKAGHYDQAVPLLDYSLELTKEMAYPLSGDDLRRRHLRGVTLNNLGCMERRRGHFQQALGYMQQSVECTGVESPVAYMNMSAILTQLRLSEEAAAMAQRAVELLEAAEPSGTPDGLSLLAVAHHNLAMALEPTDQARCLHEYATAHRLARTALGPDSATTQTIEKSWRRCQQAARPGTGPDVHFDGVTDAAAFHTSRLGANTTTATGVWRGKAGVAPLQEDDVTGIFPHPFLYGTVKKARETSAGAARQSTPHSADVVRSGNSGLMATVGAARRGVAPRLPLAAARTQEARTASANGVAASPPVTVVGPRAISRQVLRHRMVSRRRGSDSGASSSASGSPRGGFTSPPRRSPRTRPSPRTTTNTTKTEERPGHVTRPAATMKAKTSVTAAQKRRPTPEKPMARTLPAIAAHTSTTQQRTRPSPRQSNSPLTERKAATTKTTTPTPPRSSTHVTRTPPSGPAPAATRRRATPESAATTKQQKQAAEQTRRRRSSGSAGPERPTPAPPSGRTAVDSARQPRQQRRRSTAESSGKEDDDETHATAQASRRLPAVVSVPASRVDESKTTVTQSRLSQTRTVGMHGGRKPPVSNESMTRSEPTTTTTTIVRTNIHPASQSQTQQVRKPVALPPIRSSKPAPQARETEAQAAAAASATAASEAAAAAAVAAAVEAERAAEAMRRMIASNEKLVSFLVDRLDALLLDETRYAARETCAMLFQRIGRGYLARREAARLLGQRSPVLVTAKESVRVGRQQQQSDPSGVFSVTSLAQMRQEMAATLLQRVTRGWSARRALQARRRAFVHECWAATMIQRFTRMAHARLVVRQHAEAQRVAAQQKAATLIQRAWRESNDRARRRAAARARGLQLRAEAAQRRQRAALVLQCAWRSCQARRRYHTLYAAHAELAARRALYARRRSATIKLQSLCRMLIVQRMTQPQLALARARAAAKIRQGQQSYRAACTLQRAYRCYKARAELTRRRLDREALRRARREAYSACQLQRVGRGYLARAAIAHDVAAMQAEAARYQARLHALHAQDAAALAAAAQWREQMQLCEEEEAIARVEIELEQTRTMRECKQALLRPPPLAATTLTPVEPNFAATPSSTDSDEATRRRHKAHERPSLTSSQAERQRCADDTAVLRSADVLSGLVRIWRARQCVAALQARRDAKLRQSEAAEEERATRDEAALRVTRFLRLAAAKAVVRRRADAVRERSESRVAAERNIADEAVSQSRSSDEPNTDNVTEATAVEEEGMPATVVVTSTVAHEVVRPSTASMVMQERRMLDTLQAVEFTEEVRLEHAMLSDLLANEQRLAEQGITTTAEEEAVQPVQAPTAALDGLVKIWRARRQLAALQAQRDAWLRQCEAMAVLLSFLRVASAKRARQSRAQTVQQYIAERAASERDDVTVHEAAVKATLLSTAEEDMTVVEVREGDAGRESAEDEPVLVDMSSRQPAAMPSAKVTASTMLADDDVDVRALWQDTVEGRHAYRQHKIEQASTVDELTNLSRTIRNGFAQRMTRGSPASADPHGLQPSVLSKTSVFTGRPARVALPADQHAAALRIYRAYYAYLCRDYVSALRELRDRYLAVLQDRERYDGPEMDYTILNQYAKEKHTMQVSYDVPMVAKPMQKDMQPVQHLPSAKARNAKGDDDENEAALRVTRFLRLAAAKAVVRRRADAVRERSESRVEAERNIADEAVSQSRSSDEPSTDSVTEATAVEEGGMPATVVVTSTVAHEVVRPSTASMVMQERRMLDTLQAVEFTEEVRLEHAMLSDLLANEQRLAEQGITTSAEEEAMQPVQAPTAALDGLVKIWRARRQLASLQAQRDAWLRQCEAMTVLLSFLRVASAKRARQSRAQTVQQYIAERAASERGVGSEATSQDSRHSLSFSSSHAMMTSDKSTNVAAVVQLYDKDIAVHVVDGDDRVDYNYSLVVNMSMQRPLCDAESSSEQSDKDVPYDKEAAMLRSADVLSGLVRIWRARQCVAALQARRDAQLQQNEAAEEERAIRDEAALRVTRFLRLAAAKAVVRRRADAVRERSESRVEAERNIADEAVPQSRSSDEPSTDNVTEATAMEEVGMPATVVVTSTVAHEVVRPSTASMVMQERRMLDTLQAVEFTEEVRLEHAMLSDLLANEQRLAEQGITTTAEEEAVQPVQAPTAALDGLVKIWRARRQLAALQAQRDAWLRQCEAAETERLLRSLQETAARKLQRFFRVIMARKTLNTLRQAQRDRLVRELAAEEMLNEAATYIQSVLRTHLTRLLMRELLCQGYQDNHSSDATVVVMPTAGMCGRRSSSHSASSAASGTESRVGSSLPDIDPDQATAPYSASEDCGLDDSTHEQEDTVEGLTTEGSAP